MLTKDGYLVSNLIRHIPGIVAVALVRISSNLKQSWTDHACCGEALDP